MTAVVVLVLLVVVVVVVLRVRRFGGVGAAFSRRDKVQRRELVEAQKALRAAVKVRDGQLAPARQASERAVAAYVQRVQSAEAALAQAREPGTGARLARLGQVALHEHVLELPGRTVPLQGLQVAVQPTYSMCALVVQLPDGQRVSTPFSTEWRTDSQGRRSRDFEDAQVQRLADDIHNAVLAERRFREEQPRRVQHAEAQRRAAVADSAEMASALAAYDEAQQRVPATEQALQAHERLVALEDAWVRRLAAGGRAAPSLEGPG